MLFVKLAIASLVASHRWLPAVTLGSYFRACLVCGRGGDPAQLVACLTSLCLCRARLLPFVVVCVLRPSVHAWCVPVKSDRGV